MVITSRSTLSSFHLAYNAEHSVLLCLDCKSAVEVRIKYAIGAENNVLSVLYGLRKYAMACPTDSGNAYAVIWSLDGESFSFNGDMVRLQDIRRMAVNMVQEVVERGIQLERLRGATPPPLDVAGLRDVVGEKSVGYSIVSEAHNQEDQRFLRAFFAALYWTAAPASRGSEAQTLQVINTAERTRDVVLGPGGSVIIDTAHSKSAWRGVYVDRVSQILPVELGQAFVRYLFTTLPTINKLRFLLHGTPAPDLLFVFPNGTPWSADSLGDTIRNATQYNGLGTAVAPRTRRRPGLAVEDGDERVEGQDPFFGDLQLLGSALHGQSNHSATTASVHYHDDASMRKGLGVDRQISAIMASAAWHRLLGLTTKFHEFHDPTPSAAAAAPLAAAAPPLPPPSTTTTTTTTSRTTEMVPFSAPPPRPAKHTALPVSVLRIIAQLCGRMVSCKTEGQARALNRLCRTRDSFAAILPTGAGKSLLWLVAAKLAAQKGQLVGLFLPFVALREDAKRVAKEAGTGTLTANKLFIHEPFTSEGVDVNYMMAVAALASSHNVKSLDPIDKVTLTTLKDYPGAQEELASGWTTQKFTPFDPVSKHITAEVQKDGVQYTAAKGAPNAILKLCAPPAEQAAEYRKVAGDFAARGFRSLGVAIKDSQGWRLLGLLPMFDPPAL
ncbi:unnamed protein product [Tilletia controversa]|nr:unnamed protein product [Tilletia controversa]CAD6921714.1 unnamed protein product [Tilletia controversa]